MAAATKSLVEKDPYGKYDVVSAPWAQFRTALAKANPDLDSDDYVSGLAEMTQREIRAALRRAAGVKPKRR